MGDKPKLGPRKKSAKKTAGDKPKLGGGRKSGTKK